MCLRHAAYSVVAQIGHDSVAVAPPPLPSSSSTLPFSKNRAGKVLDQSERVRAADSLSQPWTRHGNFSIFSTQIFGLNILEGGILCNRIIYRIFVSNNNSALGMCLEAEKNLGRNFNFQRGSCYYCRSCSVNPGFPLFPPSSFLNFWHGSPLKYVTPDFNQNFEQNFFRDREQDLGTELKREMHLFRSNFWFTRIKLGSHNTCE